MIEALDTGLHSPDGKNHRQRHQAGTVIHELRAGCSHPRKQRCPTCVWVYRYFADTGGKRVRRKVVLGKVAQIPTKDDAKHASEYLRIVANPEHPRPGITVRGLVEFFIEQVLRPCLIKVGATRDEIAPMGYGCARSYLSRLRNHVLPRWGKYGVHQFEKPEIRLGVENWLRGLVRTQRNPDGLAPKSVKHIFAAMAQAFKYGVKLGYLNFNPLSEKRIDLPRGSSKRLKQPSQLTPRQLFSLLSKLTLLPKLAVAFLAWLGPRFSEAFGLKWRDLDLKVGRVSFRQGFSEGRITDLKTPASRADLTIPPEVLHLLRKLHSKTPYKAPDDWVFASPYTRGERPFYPEPLMYTHVRPVARELGLPDFGWHDLRHSLAAWSKNAGLHDDDVTKLLRQDTIDMAAVYGQEDISFKTQLQNKVFDYIRREGRKPLRRESQQRRGKKAAKAA